MSIKKLQIIGDLPGSKELFFSNYLEFPNIGEPDKLYIAVDENAIYRFDEKQNIYRKIENEVSITSIQSKLKEE